MSTYVTIARLRSTRAYQKINSQNKIIRNTSTFGHNKHLRKSLQLFGSRPFDLDGVLQLSRSLIYLSSHNAQLSWRKWLEIRLTTFTICVGIQAEIQTIPQTCALATSETTCNTNAWVFLPKDHCNAYSTESDCLVSVLLVQVAVKCIKLFIDLLVYIYPYRTLQISNVITF